MRGSRAAQAAAMAAVASVEPSSAISISQSGKVWAATEAMVASRVAAAFQAGVMTETAGVMGRDRGISARRGRTEIRLESVWAINDSA